MRAALAKLDPSILTYKFDELDADNSGNLDQAEVAVLLSDILGKRVATGSKLVRAPPAKSLPFTSANSIAWHAR